MEINLKNAVKKFYNNAPLKDVYLEAVVNSLDANADAIDIIITINERHTPDSFVLEISDNGDGFNDKNYKKFSSLLENEDEEHKGLGRLVYLSNFGNININSTFDNQNRIFDFNFDFSGKDIDIIDRNCPNKTTLRLSEYNKARIANFDWVSPSWIKNTLLTTLLPRLYTIKESGRSLTISIRKDVIGQIMPIELNNVVLTLDDLPELTSKEIIINELGFIDNKFDLLYSVREKIGAGSLLTAISIDGRLITQDIFRKGSVPPDYEVIFIMSSHNFLGQTNSNREKIMLDQCVLDTIGQYFTKCASEILNEEIPNVKEINNKIYTEISDKYPQYIDYFNKNYVGLISKEQAIEEAEKELIKVKKKILDASELTDEIYEQSIDVSSRVLAEYILYRTRIIEKLKSVTSKDNEDKIHNIILPKRKICSDNDDANTLFYNNIWLLDDKFMSYSYVLSEREMTDLIEKLEIEDDNLIHPDGRPDIAIIFSSDVTTLEENEKVDVVIIELKKMGVHIKEKREAIGQLRDRARRLYKYHPNKIDRLWFYAVVDFDEEFMRELREEKWVKVFSHGTIYYKEVEIEDDSGNMRKAMMTLLSHDALWKDAENRNSTFLKILKNGFKREKKFNI